MSFPDPPQLILQYSNLDGSIAHQGVLASNISGTTLLTSTFPSTNTGTSLGHYHYTESETNALQFLNASGAGDGGHQFWNSSSSSAPVKYLETNKDRTIVNTNFTVDKSVQGGATLVDLPAIIVGTSSQIVFNYPPGLDTFGIQYGVYTNPVQVLFNAGVFVTGITYYAQATNAQTLVIRATTNPSDPPLDCSVFTFGQIPFAYVSGTSPSTIQTAVLSDSLTITTETNSSVLSATDLTFNSVSLPATVSSNTSSIRDLQIKQISVINQNISAAIYADGRPPTAPTTTIAQQYAYSPSWYFINSFNSNNKINWYVPATSGLTVASILGLYCSFFNGANTSNDNTPFITVYTTPTGSGDYAPGFFHSAMTYIFNPASSITANTRYTEFIGFNSCPTPQHYASTLISLVQSPISPNPRGSYLPTEVVEFFSIGTNSVAPKNSLEIAVSKFGIMTASGTTEINFFPV